MLAFVGEANEGLLDGGCARTGMRLGVVGASIGIDVVGDVLRRFHGEASIAYEIIRTTAVPSSAEEFAR